MSDTGKCNTFAVIILLWFCAPQAAEEMANSVDINQCRTANSVAGLHSVVTPDLTLRVEVPITSTNRFK